MKIMIRTLLTLAILAAVPCFAATDMDLTSGSKIPRRPECGILLPERNEGHDVARLVRADQFLECEHEGFPKTLAPPWKETEEAEKKLGDACEYFAVQSAKKYLHVGQADLKLAADPCLINVMQIILTKMVEGLGQPPK